MSLRISREERRKFCECCNKETTWEILHRDEGVTIIQCKEYFKVEQVYEK